MNNIYIIVFFTAVVILYLVRIIICYNYAKIKGKYGERQVAKTLMPYQMDIQYSMMYIFWKMVRVHR